MATPKTVTWPIEPHTLAKHEILRRYLGAWFPILSTGYGRIIYLDGFCGPGRYANGEPGSPLIALNEALRHADRLRNNKLTFLFMDQNSERIASLESELAQLDLPGNFCTIVQNVPFETQLRSTLDSLEARKQELAPTFAFIDPFGMKGVPYDLVYRLLGNRSTEVLINFAQDPVNRWLDHPDDKIRKIIVDLFGTEEVFQVSEEPYRATALRLLYQRQLEKCAKFVRYFEMRNSRDRTIYCLFFASKHALGHKKMKEAFWAVDPAGGFQFSDATNPDQLWMFEDDPAETLASTLNSVFLGKSTLVERVVTYVNDFTPYLERHAKNALKILERDKKLVVAETKPDGKKRRNGTFPDGLEITFL